MRFPDVRRLYLFTVATMLLAGVVAAWTRSEVATTILLLSLPIEAVAAVGATWYLWRIYTQAGRSSWVFLMLVVACIVKLAAAAYIGALAGLSLAGIQISRESSAPFTIVVVGLLMSPPIYYALTVAERRRRTGRPLPLAGED